MKPVFLIGFMATGKTTVGRLVAARLALRFVDLDDVIAEAAGRSVAEIFQSEGEAGFRRREIEAVQAACRIEDAVVATGGGAACREETLAGMLEAGRVVALSATPAAVIERSKGGAGRPLLAGAAQPDSAVRSLLREREPFYARAHHRVDTAGRSPDSVAEEVVRILESGPWTE